jgi:hypothetical protein
MWDLHNKKLVDRVSTSCSELSHCTWSDREKRCTGDEKRAEEKPIVKDKVKVGVKKDADRVPAMPAAQAKGGGKGATLIQQLARDAKLSDQIIQGLTKNNITLVTTLVEDFGKKHGDNPFAILEAMGLNDVSNAAKKKFKRFYDGCKLQVENRLEDEQEYSPPPESHIQLSPDINSRVDGHVRLENVSGHEEHASEARGETSILRGERRFKPRYALPQSLNVLGLSALGLHSLATVKSGLRRPPVRPRKTDVHMSLNRTSAQDAQSLSSPARTVTGSPVNAEVSETSVHDRHFSSNMSGLGPVPPTNASLNQASAHDAYSSSTSSRERLEQNSTNRTVNANSTRMRLEVTGVGDRPVRNYYIQQPHLNQPWLMRTFAGLAR